MPNARIRDMFGSLSSVRPGSSDVLHPRVDRMPLLVDVWREACRHLQIDGAVELIAPLVGRKIPIQAMVVRRFDLQRLKADTVAVCWLDEQPAPDDPREASTRLGSDVQAALFRWHRDGGLVRRIARAGDPLEGVVGPSWWKGDVIAGL